MSNDFYMTIRLAADVMRSGRNNSKSKSELVKSVEKRYPVIGPWAFCALVNGRSRQTCNSNPTRYITKDITAKLLSENFPPYNYTDAKFT